MNPHNDPDEGWADLARELGLESPSELPASPPPPIEAVRLPFPTQNVERYEPEDDSGFGDFPEDDSAELDSDSESEADEGEESTTPEGDEAPKKKKRRRRRRKKRTGTEIGQAPQSLAENETEQDDGEDDSEADDDSEEEVEETAPVEADRGWANWDVPSWESIVLGLHRPTR